jgi:acyl-coenzyme A thioesterase PaaI-like protein
LETKHFDNSPDPYNPGWLNWNMTDPTRYNGQTLGKMIVRLEDEGSTGLVKARMRMFPEHKHSNLLDTVHGGAILGFIDVALFSASRMFGLIDIGSSVTLDLSTQFIGAGKIGEPMDAETELLKETHRLIFLRGLVLQGETMVASYSGTIRKPTIRQPSAQ